MVSYEIYKFVHLLGVVGLGLSLGYFINGWLTGETDFKGRKGKVLHAVFGLSLLALIVAGFGLVARLNLEVFPSWVMKKTILWVAIAAAVVVPKKASNLAVPASITMVSLLILAVYYATIKPI